MTRIAVITTGDCEQRALARSLNRLFPDAEFVSRPRRDGFTSCRLPKDAPTRRPVPTAAEKLAGYLVGELYPGRRSDRVDYALVVDDLEVDNLDQPEVAVKHFLGGLRSHVERTNRHISEQNRVWEILRDRGSFHFFSPMIEAYFFGETNALRRAGVAKGVSIRCDTDDLENFRTDDEEYLAAHEADPLAAQHPKRYIQHLLGRPYSEISDGVRALECLDWASCTRAAAATRFAHSMFEDLAQMLIIPNPCPGECHPLTFASTATHLRKM